MQRESGRWGEHDDDWRIDGLGGYDRHPTATLRELGELVPAQRRLVLSGWDVAAGAVVDMVLACAPSDKLIARRGTPHAGHCWAFTVDGAATRWAGPRLDRPWRSDRRRRRQPTPHALKDGHRCRHVHLQPAGVSSRGGRTLRDAAGRPVGAGHAF